MEIVTLLEKASTALLWIGIIGAAVSVVVRVAEALSVLGNRPSAFGGLKLLYSATIPRTIKIVPSDEWDVREHSIFKYVVNEDGELLFTGGPQLFRMGFPFKGRIVPQGGATTMEVRASLAICLQFVSVVLILLGVTVRMMLSDGIPAGSIFLLISAGILAINRWVYRFQIRRSYEFLEEIDAGCVRDSELRFKCSKCGTALEADQTDSGGILCCPECGADVVVP
jgi:DNA-directed RNA polymerase subunit RPC12/RpoP